MADGAPFDGSSDTCHIAHKGTLSATCDLQAPSADQFLAIFKAAKGPIAFIRAMIHHCSVLQGAQQEHRGDTQTLQAFSCCTNNLVFDTQVYIGY